MALSTNKPVLSAVLLAFGGFSIWTVSDACIRYLRDYPPVQLAFLGGVYSLALMLCFAPFLGGIRETFAKGQYKLQIARAAMLTASALATIYTFMHMPLTTAFAIIFLSPLAAKVLSMGINREKIPLRLWLTSLMGLFGVLIIIRPGFAPFGLPQLVALSIPLFFATGFVLNRTIGEANQTKMSANFYCDIMLIVVFAIPTLIHFTPMPLEHFLLVILYSVSGAMGTVLVSLGYARAPTAYVAPVHYTQILWGALWGALLFHEYPDIWVISGAAIIIAAGLALVWQSRNV